MSRAAELMAKLAPRGIAFGIVSFGGRPELTPQDIAAAIGMAHLEALTERLLRVRYVGDMTVWEDLQIGWYLRVVDIGIAQKWKRDGEVRAGKQRAAEDFPVWQLMSLVSLIEHCSEARCHSCKGIGELMIDKTVKTCPTCKGMRRMPVGGRTLAKLSGVSHQVWRTHCDGPMDVCRVELHRIDDRGCARVGARLRRKETLNA